MDYIYAKLNEKIAENQSVDYVPTEIENSRTIAVNKLSDNEFRLEVNTDKLVRLVQVQDDSTTSEDSIQKFRLCAYNTSTGQYDILLGDEIVIDKSGTGSGDEILDNLSHAVIAGQQVPAYIDRYGQLVLQYIPSIALSDKIQVKDENGNITYQQVESIIDGNDDDDD